MAASNAAGGTAAEASRIFVFAGTADGRQLVSALLAKGFAVTASVVSRYGGELLESAQIAGHDLVVNVQPLDEAGLVAYCRTHAIAAIVDASHPYAVNVSENAMAAAKELGLPYLRYERSLSELDYDNIHIVHSYEAAAEMAASLGNTIFLTTGSNPGNLTGNTIVNITDSNSPSRRLPRSLIIRVNILRFLSQYIITTLNRRIPGSNGITA